MQGSCQPRCPPCSLACPSRYFAACDVTGAIVSDAESAAPSRFHRSIKWSRSRRIAVKARWHHLPIADACGDTELAYKMVAERDNETVKVERMSSFVIVAKARIWASEGWQVVITDAEGKSYALAEFDQLLAA
jgi:hypothetical protein